MGQKISINFIKYIFIFVVLGKHIRFIRSVKRPVGIFQSGAFFVNNALSLHIFLPHLLILNAKNSIGRSLLAKIATKWHERDLLLPLSGSEKSHKINSQ